jgi:hypothetical protein
LLVISEAAIRLDKLDPTAAPRLAPSVEWLVGKPGKPANALQGRPVDKNLSFRLTGPV